MRVFGYGSLVNTATHSLGPGTPRRIDGWVRHWVHIGPREVAILSTRRCPGMSLDGLVLDVPETDRPALILREAAYDPVSEDDLTVFSIPPDKHPEADRPRPILLSYLDTVVQGFLHRFGPDGVAGFFASTEGWGEIRDDRAAPVYPRAQRLTALETALCDRHLAALGVRVVVTG
jgi:hypothetical protein